MRNLLFISTALLLSYNVVAQSFVLANEISPGLRSGEVSWGDLNNDGKLDFIETGGTINATATTRMYINTTSGFKAISTQLPNIFEGRSDWGDYDNDGDQDLLLAGWSSTAITKIYRNFNGVFIADNSNVLHGIDRGSVEWGDYDADGDLDILLSGQDANSNSVTKIYKNTASVFSELTSTGITGISFGQASWVDFDSDGDLDVMIAGVTGTAPNTGPKVSKLYLNTGSVFSEVLLPNNFEGVNYSSMAFGDYDNDGDMDILLAGFTNSNTAFTGIYQNNGASFDLVFEGDLPKVIEGKVLWGDTDNDGDLDVFISGNIITGNAKIAALYTNTGSGFVLGHSFPEAGQSTAEFVDFDSDGDLDIFISGQKNDGSLYSNIYTNTNSNQSLANNANDLPLTPTGLTFKKENKKVILGWNKSTDNETAQATLTYNVYLRSATDTIVNPLSLATGKRKIGGRGNTGHFNSVSLNNVSPGDYTWSVQTIDNSYSGSAFAESSVVHVNFPPQITGVKTPLTTPANTPLLITSNDLNIVDPDNNPDDFILTVFGGPNYTVSNNLVTPNLNFQGDLLVPVSVNDGIDESEKFTIQVRIPIVVGLKDELAEDNFSIYPNPVRNQLIVRSNDSMIHASLELYTSTGSRINLISEEVIDNTFTIDLSEFTRGIYILRVKSGKYVRQVKIVKE
jgi:hypothetical protein